MATGYILDLKRAFMETAEVERTGVDLPLGVIDLNQADVCAAKRLTDVLGSPSENGEIRRAAVITFGE